MDAIEKRAREIRDEHCPAGNYCRDDILFALIVALTPQWQPIESAPKTTRSILVWCPERQNQYMVSWDDRYGGEWRTFGGLTGLSEMPTHWQPLPAPPEETP